MAALSPKSFRLLMAGLLIGLGLAVWYSASKGKPAAGQADPPSAAKPSPRADRNARTSPRETMRKLRSITSAPSAPASDEVAELIGDETLADNEVIDQLQALVAANDRPLAERTEALEHLVLLVESDQPAPLYELAAMALLPSDLMLSLSDESLNRPEEVRGEILLRLLEHATGDVREEILEELRFLTGVSEDPNDWRAQLEASKAEEE